MKDRTTAAVAPYGTWSSPISATTVAAQGLRLGYVSLHGDAVYWIEGRPQEGGRNVLVRRSADGTIADVTPPPYNVRSRVHEYGGAAYIVAGSEIWFSNFSDQRVYRIDDHDFRLKAEATASPDFRLKAEATGSPDFRKAEATPITPEGPWCYADYEVDRRRNRLICVREDHSTPGREPENAIVAIAMDGRGPTILAAGYDFYSTPRLAPDGSRLCWLSWRHPNMPWDGTELWVADIADDGSLHHPRQIAGGPRESVYQPGWMADGLLCFASDRTGYWHLYDEGGRHLSGDAGVTDAEFGRPQWIFGSATWAAAGPGTLVVSYTRRGCWRLGRLDVASGRIDPLAPGIEPGEWLAADRKHAIAIGGSATTSPSVMRVDLATGTVEALRSSATQAIDPADVSVPLAIEYPTGHGRTAHAVFYAPHSHAFTAPAGEQPPLIVISHGGPTTATRTVLDPAIQFWTSRGFGVVDVNYGGSSGYGRSYRERLNGAWGIVDVEDCVNAARALVAQGKADARRLVIRGGSAGGYTTLAALTFRPEVFAAGASYYGISDLEVLARDTHKFESRYLDTLVGPYPAATETYRARSPIHFVDRLSCPLILLQGLEDKVVPPNQAQMMADAVSAKGLQVALLLFEGEQHGFRRADTVVRSLEAELYFYGVVFGFQPADAIAPIAITNT